MFKYSLDNKRYHTLNYFFKTKFGKKVAKIPIDINAGCPNQIEGGCIYCSNKSKSNIIIDTVDYIKQFNNTCKIMEKKWPDCYYIPYFQSGTNTYIDVSIMKKIIDELLKNKKVVGICIATRSDAINDAWYEYLDELNKKTFLMIELGLQSAKDETLELINRKHTVSNFTETTLKLKKMNIFVVAHIINGLPFEDKNDMLNTVKYLNKIKIDGIKIHMLYVCKNTKLANMYNEKKFELLSKEEYINIVCEQICLLDPNIVIERLTSDPIKEELIAPSWLLKKFCVLNDIDKQMVKLNYYQGIKKEN